MKTFQLMLSIRMVYTSQEASGSPLGNLDSYDMPHVDEADLELVVKLLDTFAKLSDHFLVVWIQVISCEAGGLHIAQSPHKGNEEGKGAQEPQQQGTPRE